MLIVQANQIRLKAIMTLVLKNTETKGVISRSSRVMWGFGDKGTQIIWNNVRWER